MPEPVDPTKRSSPPATFTLCGGCLGAVLVYLISLAMIVAYILPTMYRDRLGWASLKQPETLQVVKIALQEIFIAFTIVSIIISALASAAALRL